MNRLIKGNNSLHMKIANISLVLEIIKKHGPISRTDLAEMTGLRPSTITNIVNELLGAGFLRSAGDCSSKTGRRRVLLALNGACYWIAGIHIERNRIRGILSDFIGKVEQAYEFPSDPDLGPRPILEQAQELTEMLLRDARLARKPVLGIGVGVPGPVDTELGVVRAAPNFKDWNDVAVADIMKSRFTLPVIVDDDARLAGLGEFWWGAAQGIENVIYLGVTEGGIGGSVILGGKLYRGINRLAGEIGHMSVDANGPLCECGNYGCLERVASIRAILETIRKDSGNRLEVSSIEDVALLYDRGDPVVHRAVERAECYLVTGIVNAVNLYDPDMIVLGGKLFEVFPRLLEVIKEEFRRRTTRFKATKVQLLPAALGANSASVGAACLILEELFKDPLGFMASRKAFDLAAYGKA